MLGVSTMKHECTIAILCLVLAAVGLLCLVFGRGARPVSSQQATVAFLGFTNFPAKGRHAILSFTPSEHSAGDAGLRPPASAAHVSGAPDYELKPEPES